MSDDKLNMLGKIEVPEPSAAARTDALEAAMLAFDAAQSKNSQTTTQGKSWGDRLRSIVQRGTSIMDTRLSYGLGTAAIALLLLPLGYQLYTSTALTPLSTPPVVVTPDADLPVVAADDTELATRKVTTVTVKPDGQIGGTVAPQQPATVAGTERTDVLKEESPKPVIDAGNAAVIQQSLDEGRAEPVPQPAEAKDSEADLSAQLAVNSNMAAPATEAMPLAVDAMVAPAPTLMAGSVAPGLATATQPSGDQFSSFTESPVKLVKEAPVSTFSIDVDTASYSYVRRAIEEGWVPEPDSVRLEELINYFPYSYPAPDGAGTPFKPTIAIYPTPWNLKTQLLQIGIKGYVPPAAEHKPANLVFLIDTSGSMDEPDKLPLLKRAFALLVDQLSANDTVSIVVYAGSAGVVLEPTKASDKSKILSALENLAAGGSTAGAEGIELAYRLAEKSKVADGVNRVILATDGDFNVGIEDPEELKTYIKQKRDSGVFLSVLGFGAGNLGDDTMQALAQNGNGNASYIDSFKEAQKVLVAEGGGTLETIAKDVKIQVEFNPAFVSEYRLVGYETRALNREDFNNDKVDAGDIGAGTTVTALYEITPAGSEAGLIDPLHFGESTDTPVAAVMPSDEIAFLKLRYKLPDSDDSTLVETPITRSLAVDSLAAAGEDQRFAAVVAAFGQKLKGSNYGDMDWAAIRALAQGARGADEAGYRAEFMQLIDGAAALLPDGK